MKYRLIALLSVGHLITDINQGALPVLLPFLISKHHLSYAAAAGIVFAANIASSVVQPLFGHFADLFSKPWILPAGLFFAGLGLSLSGILPAYHLIILAAIVSGIGIAAYHPEAARLVNFSSGDKKATAMSFFGVGGILGFAIGPMFATTVVLYWGLKGTLALVVPVSIMSLVIITQINKLSDIQKTVIPHKAVKNSPSRPDAWGAFSLLTLMVICRSIIFFALNTFIPLYWINVLHQSKAAGGAALTVMATASVFGSLLGGSLADRFGHIRITLIGFCILIPFLPALIWVNHAHVALLILIPIGFALSGTFSPTVIIGQKYLPNHIGLSSGVTIGLAVAIGGIAAPVLGKIADGYGIRAALSAIVFLPVLAALLAFALPLPREMAEASV